jgi:hypothetical protein
MGAVWALVVFGVLLLIGAPIALSVPGREPDWIGFAFEAFVIGLVVELAVAIPLLHAGWYNPFSVLALTVVVAGAATLAIRRCAGPPADLAALRTRETVLVGAGALVVVIAAFVIRDAPSYFIFQTGDMGDYVNTANVFRQGGPLIAAQPQGFTLFLSSTNLLLGEANTVAGVPALGVALLLGAMAFTRALRLHLAATIGIAVILLVNPVAVWFSLFPVSESLCALFVLALVYFVVQARATGSITYGVIGGFVAGALLLVRGEVMLLAPILVIVLLASVVTDDEPTARVQRWFTYTALVALFAAYTYDVANAHVYFLAQLDRLLPGFMMDLVERAHLERASLPLVLVGVVAFAAVLGLVRLVRHVRPRVAGRPLPFWRCAYAAVIALAAIASLSYGLGSLRNTGERWGVVLLVLVVIGAIGVVVRPGRYLDAVTGFLVLLVIGAFVVLFTRRIDQPRLHTYYLYFDRYLVSEVLAAALPLAAIGLQIVVDGCRRVPARAARFAAAAIVVVVVVALVPQVRETRRITERRLFGDSYEALDQLDRLTQSNGRGAVVYSGATTRPPNWFYPNTYRAFALPLRQTFDRTVYGIPILATEPDRVYSPRQARELLRDRNASHGYLVRLRAPAGPQIPDDEHAKWIGSVSYTSPWLAQVPSGRAAPWTDARIDLDVYEISGLNQ